MIQINSIITVQHTDGDYQAVISGNPFIFGGITRYPVIRLDNKKPWYVPENLITNVSTDFPLDVGDVVRLPGHGSSEITEIKPETVTLKFKRFSKLFGWQDRFTTIQKWRAIA